MMALLLSDPYTYLDVFLLAFVRLISFFIAAPLFGIRNVPNITKIGLAFILATIVINVKPLEIDQSSGEVIGYALLVIKEFLVGWLIGFGANLAFSIITLAGQLIDYQIGFTMVNVFDPLSQIQLTITGNLYYYLLLLIMLVTNTHYYLIRALVDSFDLVPVGRAIMNPRLYDSVLNFYGDYFVIAIKIAAPMIGVMLVTNVVLGILARTAPQMNMFVVGLPFKLLAGLIILLITITIFPSVSDSIFNRMLDFVSTLIRGLIP